MPFFYERLPFFRLFKRRAAGGSFLPVFDGKEPLLVVDPADESNIDKDGSGNVTSIYDPFSEITFVFHPTGIDLAIWSDQNALLNNLPAYQIDPSADNHYWNNGDYGILGRPFFDRNSWTVFLVFYSNQDLDTGVLFSESGDTVIDDDDRVSFLANTLAVADPDPEIGFVGWNVSGGDPIEGVFRTEKLEPNQSTIQAMTFDHTTGQMNGSFEGEAVADNSYPIVQYPTTDRYIYLFWQHSGSAEFNGGFGFFVVYPKLTIGERLAVERALADRFAIAMRFVLTATPGINFVHLEWKANPGVTTFGIERAPAAGGPWVEIDTTTALFYFDSELAAGTYFYRLTDTAGDVLSLTVESESLAAPPLAVASPLAYYVGGGIIDDNGGGTLVEWLDSSGNGNHLTTIQGSVTKGNDGKDYGGFSGSITDGGTEDTLQRVTLSATLANPATIFVVAQPVSPISNNVNMYWTDGTSGNRFAWGKGNSGANIGRLFQGNLSDSANTLFLYDEYFIHHAIFKPDPAVTPNELWINGYLDYTNTGAAQSSAGLTVGGPNDLGSNSYVKGRIRAIVVYNSELTSDQIVKTLDSLATEFIISGINWGPEMDAILAESVFRGATNPNQLELISMQYAIEQMKILGVWATADAVYLTNHSGDAEFKTINLKNPSGGRIVRPTAEISNADGYGSTNEQFNETTPSTSETIASSTAILNVATSNDSGLVYITNQATGATNSRFHTGNGNLCRLHVNSNLTGLNSQNWPGVAGGMFYLSRSGPDVYGKKDDFNIGTLNIAATTFAPFNLMGQLAGSFQFSFFYRGAYMDETTYQALRLIYQDWNIHKTP